ncbi:MAG TPA: hypothetical protein GX500_01880 [Firmicutes bacterium]|nr:hypothetical protein [Candidatus Fermentithermobacillaceae bacterium]
MKRTRVILASAATYIGTVVGAGFASGQEVLQFFGLLGKKGVLAIALTAAGFAFFGYATMEVGRKMNAASHLPVIRDISGRFLSPLLDIITTFFLFGALSAMVAGAGSVLAQELSVPWLIGAGLMVVATVVTVLFGLKGVVAAVSTVVPLLIIGVLAVSLSVISARGATLSDPPAGTRPLVPAWPLAGATYISYNMIMSVPVLASLGTTLRSKREVALSAALGAVGLGAALFLVFLAVVSSLPDVLRYEIPMAGMASEVYRIGGRIYTLIFLAEVYTTAVANLYGFSARLAAPDTLGFKLVTVVAGSGALLAGSVGFTNLVRTVYPAVGWAGSVFLVAIVVYALRGKLGE